MEAHAHIGLLQKTSGRETAASGMGWELFLNYVIAKDKFKPDFFLYENNWSASTAIKDQIQRELQTKLFRMNSSLVSAQNRDRFYVFNWDVELPKDRGILLRDILETSDIPGEPTYELDLPLLSNKEIEYMVRKTSDGRNHFDFGHFHDANKSKSSCITATISKGVPYNVLCEPVRIGTIKNNAKNQAKHNSKQYRVYSPDGKSTTLCGEGGDVGAKTGLYAIPVKNMSWRGRGLHSQFEVRDDQKSASLTTGHQNRWITFPASDADIKSNRIEMVYEVRNGLLDINGSSYPIKLEDGFYIIRKLTVKECCRLQGMPDWWFLDKGGNPLVSNTQAYRGLGNGWQLDTVKYILQNGLKSVPRDDKIVVLSMYDGIGTGRRILEELGFSNVEYHAYEIDKYCIKVTSYRYPDIIHHGDAFQIRDEGWRLN